MSLTFHSYTCMLFIYWSNGTLFIVWTSLLLFRTDTAFTAQKVVAQLYIGIPCT